MRHLVVVVLALTAGCSNKKEGQARPTGEAAAPPAATPETTPPAAEPTAMKAPAMTPEMLYAEQPAWTIQMLDRGLWVRAGNGPVEHKCRQDLAMVVAKNGAVRMAGKAQAGATTCAPKAGLAVCTFKNATPNPAVDPPDGVTHWVFTGTDAEPIMVAILTGPQDDLDTIAPELTKIEACPRPSDDPQ